MNDTFWNGEGLPPVGAECEFTHEGDGVRGRWVKCRIAGYTSNYRHVAIETDDDLYADDEGLVFLWSPTAIQWRPFRTPEQIAAEEREKAVETMVRIAMTRPDWRGTCEALYDAGYRKQGEQP